MVPGNNRIVSDNPRGLNGSAQHSAETHRDHRHNQTSDLSGYATNRELREFVRMERENLTV
jgi:hypothetical protein